MNDRLLHMRYLGVLSLLGRISTHADLSADDRQCIERAFADGNAHLKETKSEVVFAKCGPRGWAAFDREQAQP